MIELEIVPSDAVENLLLREADIAIRMFRPGQLDVVGKKNWRSAATRLRAPIIP